MKTASYKHLLISTAALTIYDDLDPASPLWLTAEEIEYLLRTKLRDFDLEGLALRTRSKVVKMEVCKALGYPVPKSFKKTQPRFPGQNFDVYTQKSTNLQVWNEELSQDRRYVILRVDASDKISDCRVITGADLAELDTTGTLTQKYQARLTGVDGVYELVNTDDSDNLKPILTKRDATDLSALQPTEAPRPGYLLPISELHNRLKSVVGQSFSDPGSDQERNRGAALHGLVCRALGYASYADNGRFPDILNQLLEVKLQTSPTVDLGLVTPDSESKLDMNAIENIYPRHCDVRYALFVGYTDNNTVMITNLIVANGVHFFGRIPRFEGNVLNKKLQIRLSDDFFNR